MEPGSPEWIEASLAKLEQLEQQRATHQQGVETVKEPMALRRHTEALGRLDAEIKALYAQLESFAEDDEEEEEEEGELATPAATPERRTEGDETLSAPHKAAEPMVASTPPAAAISSAPPFVSMPAPSAGYDDDEPKGGAGKWIFLGVLLVGGLGAGGFFMMQGQKKAADQPANDGSGEVIKAGEVPPDTEDLKAAKGADVDRTPLPNQGGGGAGTSGGGGGGSSKKDKKDDDKKVLKLDGGDDDPLG
jgi:hypothetical protein